MTTATSPILLKWDPKSLEIRTLTVERLLEPLVTQVTTLVNTSNKGPSSKKKGRSKKAHVLAVSVEQATQNFLEKGEQIAKDSQDLKEELIAAVEDVRKQGETMRIASSEFADDPCSSVKRGTMVRAARALLSAVTRLLILADMADVMRLLAHLKIVEEALEGVKNATNEQDLANRFKEFGKEMVKLNYVAARRQQELKDPQCRDEMAAARGALKKNATMLYTASQAFLRHPDVAATRANRDYVFKQVQEAIGGISSAAQATSPTDEKHGHAGIGELAAALNEFDNKIILDPLTFSEARFRPSLEERLESIISGAALMADSSCTRDDRRERIVAECNAVRQALQDLLSEYMNNVSPSLVFIAKPLGWISLYALTVTVRSFTKIASEVFTAPEMHSTMVLQTVNTFPFAQLTLGEWSISILCSQSHWLLERCQSVVKDREERGSKESRQNSIYSS
uniref:catenin alpha-2 isoform X2 n=1 Tax=Solea senegalensis TaxID=28829 RepID=UPI001CD8E3C5|nr:catenin alpha-2 isoform X2 [Solea senegalensis]